MMVGPSLGRVVWCGVMLMVVAVVNNEHLTEALRRLRKNSSDNNVDRQVSPQTVYFT